MEAALRSAYYFVTGSNPDPEAFRDVRGLGGWKEATFDLPGRQVRVAVASGLANAGRLMDAMRAGEVELRLRRGHGVPRRTARVAAASPSTRAASLPGVRGQVLYGLDAVNNLRFSHENPSVARCYEEFLGAPLSEKAHHLLHSDHFDWSMPHA